MSSVSFYFLGNFKITRNFKITYCRLTYVIHIISIGQHCFRCS